MMPRECRDAMSQRFHHHSSHFDSYVFSVPYKGVLPDFMQSLQDLSMGDINVTYTYGSRSSKLLYPFSAYTAAIQDIKDGLVDMAIGSYWITGERLKMAAFTVPISKCCFLSL